MSNFVDPNLQYTVVSTSCSYYPERIALLQVIESPNPSTYQQRTWFLQGYRRLGVYWYRPICKNCSLCIPYRLPLSLGEKVYKKQRIWKKNKDLICRILDPWPTACKRTLYETYIQIRHAVLYTPCWELQRHFYLQLYTNPVSTREFDYYTDQGILVGYGIVDIAFPVVSLVYFVFDPKISKRSLGTFHILNTAQWCLQNGFQYLILGYFIPQHPKMSYKARFQPAECFDWTEEKWIPFPNLEEKLRVE